MTSVLRECSAATAASSPALAARGLGVAEPLPGRVEQRQVGHRPRLGVRALQPLHLVAAERGGALAQVGRYGPQVADEVGRLQQRPGAVEGGEQFPVLPQRPAEQFGRDLAVRRGGAVVVLLHEDREQFLPDLLACLVVRGAGFGRLEGDGPVLGGQPDVGPVRGDRHALGGRLLVEPDGGLDRPHQLHGRLQPGHLRVGLDGRGGALVDEVPQDAGLHALLAEAGEDVSDVVQVGPVRPHEEHAAPAVAEARVGVEEVGGAVQGDDGLAGAGAAVDDERAA